MEAAEKRELLKVAEQSDNQPKTDERQVFTIKDLEEVSYRQLNDWDKRGFLKSCKRDNSNGWRKFSVFDITCLKIIRDMKKNLYPDNVINFILQQVTNIKPALLTGMFHSDEQDYYYLAVSQKGGYGIGKGDNSLVNFHREVSSDFKQANLLSESLLIIPIGQYYKEGMLKYFKKELELDKNNKVNPFCDMPAALRQVLILDTIENKNYIEILIRKKKADYIIKPKCKDNKLTREELVELVKNSEYENIEVKFTNGNSVFLTKEETIKIK